MMMNKYNEITAVLDLHNIINSQDELIKHLYSTLFVVMNKVTNKHKFTEQDIKYYSQSLENFKNEINK